MEPKKDNYQICACLRAYACVEGVLTSVIVRLMSFLTSYEKSKLRRSGQGRSQTSEQDEVSFERGRRGSRKGGLSPPPPPKKKKKLKNALLSIFRGIFLQKCNPGQNQDKATASSCLPRLASC